MSDGEGSDCSRRSPSAQSSSSYESSRSSRSSPRRRPEEEDRRVRDDEDARSAPSSRASTPRRSSSSSSSGSPREGSSSAWLDKGSSAPKRSAPEGTDESNAGSGVTTDFAAFYPPPPATYQASPQLTEEQEKIAILKAQQQIGLEQANKRFHDYAALHSDHIVRPPSPKSSVYLRPLSVRNRRFQQRELVHYHEELKETARRQKEEKERARLQLELKILNQKEEAHKAALSNRNWTPSPRLYPGRRKNGSPKAVEQNSTTAAAADPAANKTPRPSTAGSGKPRFETLYELSRREPKRAGRHQETQKEKPQLSTKQFVERFYALPRKEHQAEQDKMLRKYLQSPRPLSARSGKGSTQAEDRPDESATIERLAVQDIRRRSANRDALTRRYIPQPPAPEKKVSSKTIAERLYVNGVARSNAAMEKVFARAEADFKKHQIHNSVSPLSTERVRALGERLSTPKPTQ